MRSAEPNSQFGAGEGGVKAENPTAWQVRAVGSGCEVRCRQEGVETAILESSSAADRRASLYLRTVDSDL